MEITKLIVRGVLKILFKGENERLSLERSRSHADVILNDSLEEVSFPAFLTLSAVPCLLVLCCSCGENDISQIFLEKHSSKCLRSVK